MNDPIDLNAQAAQSKELARRFSHAITNDLQAMPEQYISPATLISALTGCAGQMVGITLGRGVSQDLDRLATIPEVIDALAEYFVQQIARGITDAVEMLGDNIAGIAPDVVVRLLHLTQELVSTAQPVEQPSEVSA